MQLKNPRKVHGTFCMWPHAAYSSKNWVISLISWSPWVFINFPLFFKFLFLLHLTFKTSSTEKKQNYVQIDTDKEYLIFVLDKGFVCVFKEMWKGENNWLKYQLLD